jgi:hypothetical protein
MRTIFLQVAPIVWLLVAGFGPRPTVGQQRDVLPVPNHGLPTWLVFSPDGTLLAAKTGTTQESQSITIWDVSARQSWACPSPPRYPGRSWPKPADR